LTTERVVAVAAQILLDTNLLILLVVGSFSRRLIAKFQRTRAFSERDFDRLLELLPARARLVATPHVLAETSNLIRGLDGDTLASVRRHLRNLVGELQETHVPARTAVANALFARLGLTDAGISVLAADRDVVVITADLDLYLGLEHAGLQVVNFNHYRLR